MSFTVTLHAAFAFPPSDCTAAGCPTVRALIYSTDPENILLPDGAGLYRCNVAMRQTSV